VISSLFVCSCNDDSNKVLAQDNIWENVDRLKVDIDNVIDFTADGKYFYFLTDKEIIKVDGFGKKISSEKHENVTGICWDKEAKGLHKILKNCIIMNAKGDSIKIDTIKQGSGKIGIIPESYTITMHLAFDGKKYYCCIYWLGLPKLEEANPSDQIISISIYGNAEIFDYFKTIPGGLFYHSDNLFFLRRNHYVFDTLNTVSHGGIIKYDKQPYLFISYPNLPIASPVGIYIDNNGSFYHYSQNQNEIFKFKGN
jgi:hypothetical protein